MPTTDTLRTLSLALPDTEEKPHHGFPSWRVKKGRIFATHPDPEHVHIMLSPDAIREAVAVAPEACEEKWWGTSLSAVRVHLGAIEENALGELLADARRYQAER